MADLADESLVMEWTGPDAGLAPAAVSARAVNGASVNLAAVEEASQGTPCYIHLSVPYNDSMGRVVGLVNQAASDFIQRQKQAYSGRYDSRNLLGGLDNAASC